MKGISPNFDPRVFWFIDVPIRFWVQKVIGQGRRRKKTEKPVDYNNFVAIGATRNFTKIRSHMYLGLETYWIGFRIKSQRSRSHTAGVGITHNQRRQPVEFHLVISEKELLRSQWRFNSTRFMWYIMTHRVCMYRRQNWLSIKHLSAWVLLADIVNTIHRHWAYRDKLLELFVLRV